MFRQERISNSDHESPAIHLHNLLSGMMVARAIHVAAWFGIADLLKNGPKSVVELAEATGTHPSSLYRLLRALESVDIFAEIEPDSFAQTELSTFLRSDVYGSMYNMARMWGTDWEWKTWGELAYSVQTGQPAFEHIHGVDLWQYLSKENPEAGRLFSLAMESSSELVDVPIATAYDFSSIHVLVDIGGGYGSLLTAILKSNPTLKGILFESPSVVEDARENLAEAGLDGRLNLIAGNFFEDVPRDADAYIMKQILHDWDDEHCIKILSNCRQAMKPDGRILVAEQVISPGNETCYGKFLDLEMLILLTGRERTEDEFRTLFEASGLRLTRIVPTNSSHSILEGSAL